MVFDRLPARGLLVALVVGITLVTGSALPADSEAPTVRLKESVELAHGPLSLGDIVVGDLERTNYSLTLGSMPKPGSVKFVSRAYVMMMARNADRAVPGFEGSVVRTRVKRPSRTLSKDDLRHEIESLVRENLAGGEDLRVSIKRVPESLSVLPGPFNLSMESAGIYQSERGSVWYRFHVRQKDKVIKSFRTKVLVSQYREVPVALRRLERGTVVQPGMLEWTKRKIGHLRGGLISEPEDVIGYELTRTVRADKTIRSSYLKKPIVVERRDRITIRYRMSGMVITTDGEAQEDGAVGDRIRVKNLSSEEELSAEVINEGLVEVNRTTGKEGNTE